MKSLFSFVLILLFGTSALAQKKTPKLAEQGYKVEDLVPWGWKKIVATSGDLNKDHIDDIVFVIQNKESHQNASYEYQKEGRLDLISRTLAIYFKDKKGLYTKEVQADNFILVKDSPMAEEPFEGVKILKNGVLQIDYRFWHNSGSWYTSTSKYQFKFKRNAFRLIGYNSFELHRATREITERHINFLSRKIYTTQTTIHTTTPVKVIKKRFRLKKLKSINSLVKPGNWEFQDIYI